MPDGSLKQPVATVYGDTPKWVLAKRSHNRALKRKAFPTPVKYRSFAERQLRLLLPWVIDEYPGLIRYASAVFGLASESARKIIDGNVQLPYKHAATLAQMFQERADAYLAAAEECRAYAAGDATKPRGFRTGHGVARNRPVGVDDVIV